ncbi:MAG: DUF3419 family protein [Woeseiaceae bacterium]
MERQTEIAGTARFDRIRYAQCWEDADTLLQALMPGAADTCLSVASAGDNTLALVGAGAGRVIAVDLNPAQIACLELRVAAYRHLSHSEFLLLMGQHSCRYRLALYQRCRASLAEDSRNFWDAHPRLIQRGIAQVGRFEEYLDKFRRFILPLVQSRASRHTLFRLKTETERRVLYEQHWNNRRWRLLCRLFFSRLFLGRFGRDPAFTKFADETVWSSLQRQLPIALVLQEPGENPYLQRILTGKCESALPWSWRPENYTAIRNNLDALEWHCAPVESVLATLPDGALDGCNLSDIFEYMSEEGYAGLLRELIRVGAPACRLVYWNVVVPRSRPESLARELRSLRDYANDLHLTDKAFFYRDLVIEEVV